MSPFQVVQVGAGLWGADWAGLLARAQGFRLAALVDTARRKREWAAQTVGCPTFRDLAAALRAVDCDAVLIVAPPGAHRSLAEQALAAGRHVAIEKPLALNVADARAIADAASRADRVAMVTQNYRFRRQPRALAQLVRARTLGQLRGGRVTCRRDLRHQHHVRDWRGGMTHPYVLDMAIHHLDLLRMITRREIVEVDVRSWTSPGGPFRHDASVVGLVTLAGGAALGYEGSWTAPSAQTSWNGDWELVGSAGTVAWTGGLNDALRGHVSLERRARRSEAVELPVLPALDRLGVLHELRRAARSGDEPECSARDNLSSLAAVLAMARSSEERRPVPVDEVLAA